MKVSIETLKKAAEELNKAIQPDPLIKITSRSSVQSLTEEIIATSELMEDGDCLTQGTIDLLKSLEVDLPALLKVKKEEKKAEKKVEKKSEKKNEKKSDKKPEKKTEKKESKPVHSGPSLKGELEGMLKEKKYTQEEIKEKLFEKFPDKKPSTITTILSDIKSEKWTPFQKVVVKDKNGVLKFS